MRAALGALFICIAAALWGLDGVVLTPRLGNLFATLPFVVFLLHAVPFALMQPFLYRSYAKLRALSRQEWVALIALALLSGLIGTLAMVKALFLVDFDHLSVVILLQKLQPLFAILLAVLLLRERPTGRFFAWALLAILGAYLLTFGIGVPKLDATLLATVYALIAAASFGTGTVLSKRLLKRLDFATATFARFGMTALLALIVTPFVGGFAFGSITTGNWITILIIALTTGSGAIFLYYYGLQRVRATTSAICELCLPLTAVILDYIVHGTLLSAWQGAGALLLIGAITRISLTAK